ncbi:unnamed protein product [Nyctereutes procyonoides]|uniref:(raccoon dog) hypothetical protein n=1 Tax=Nyctereutes procyonoides TaxID=34880 RepID=A0A811ZAP0_NYCPR|nr:unnamed protein product [Nyctereutes procyonoides]
MRRSRQQNTVWDRGLVPCLNSVRYNKKNTTDRATYEQTRLFLTVLEAGSSRSRNWLHKLDDHSLILCFTLHGSVDVFPTTSPAVFDLQSITMKDSISGQALLLTRYFSCELFGPPTEGIWGFLPIREEMSFSNGKAGKHMHRQPPTVLETPTPPVVEKSGPRHSLEETKCLHLPHLLFRTCPSCILLPVGTPLPFLGLIVRVGM